MGGMYRPLLLSDMSIFQPDSDCFMTAPECALVVPLYFVSKWAYENCY